MKKKSIAHKRKHLSNRHLSDLYTYSGEHETATGIKLTQYTPDLLTTTEIQITSAPFDKLISDTGINWFQVSGLTDAATITRLVKEFGMHNLDAKDILTPQHVVKVEEYDNHLLIITNSCYYDANLELRTEHICLMATGNVVISFTESSNPVFEGCQKALLSNMLNIRGRNTDILLAFLLNTIISNLVESASRIEEMLEDIEETLLDIRTDQKNVGQLIQQRRHEYMIIKKNSQPLKDQFAKLLRVSNGFVSKDVSPIYNDLYDQLLYVTQTIESCREIISSLVDLYISNNDLRMNAIMKRLTVVSTIFIPLTFLVGVWGMNFNSMPELEWRYGYILAWSVIILTAIIVGLFLKKKNWY